MSEPTWTNAHGEPVDLDNIDKVYALNILSHYTLNCGRLGYDHEDMRNNALVQKLRGIVLDGREPNLRDRLRATWFDVRCAWKGMPWRSGR
jgi:hypothetical protein